jgi:hypothetical protein
MLVLSRLIIQPGFLFTFYSISHVARLIFLQLHKIIMQSKWSMIFGVKNIQHKRCGISKD